MLRKTISLTICAVMCVTLLSAVAVSANGTEYTIHKGVTFNDIRADVSNANGHRENGTKFGVTENGFITKVKIHVRNDQNQRGRTYSAKIFDVTAGTLLWNGTMPTLPNPIGDPYWLELELNEPVPVYAGQDQWYMVSFTGANVPFNNAQNLVSSGNPTVTIDDKIILSYPCAFLGDAATAGGTVYTLDGIKFRAHPTSGYGLWIDIGFVTSLGGEDPVTEITNVTAEESSGIISGTVSVESNDDALEGKLIVAAYSLNHRLLGTFINEGYVTGTDDVQYSITAEGASYVKAFLWDGLDDIKPVCVRGYSNVD